MTEPAEADAAMEHEEVAESRWLRLVIIKGGVTSALLTESLFKMAVKAGYQVSVQPTYGNDAVFKPPEGEELLTMEVLYDEESYPGASQKLPLLCKDCKHYNVFVENLDCSAKGQDQGSANSRNPKNPKHLNLVT